MHGTIYKKKRFHGVSVAERCFLLFKQNENSFLGLLTLQKLQLPVTLAALQNCGAFTVVHKASGTGRKAGTGGTLGVIILPLTP